MSRPERLDLRPAFLDMSGAIHDLAELSGIAVTVLENAIREIEPSLIPASFRPPSGYVTVLLTEQQYRNVHFISEHIRCIAQKARTDLEVVEELIVEDAR